MAIKLANGVTHRIPLVRNGVVPLLVVGDEGFRQRIGTDLGEGVRADRGALDRLAADAQEAGRSGRMLATKRRLGAAPACLACKMMFAAQSFMVIVTASGFRLAILVDEAEKSVSAIMALLRQERHLAVQHRTDHLGLGGSAVVVATGHGHDALGLDGVQGVIATTRSSVWWASSAPV